MIVSIRNDGAIVMRFESGKPHVSLIYSADGIEGHWAKSHLGIMMGSTQCITASVAANINKGSADLSKYVIGASSIGAN